MRVAYSDVRQLGYCFAALAGLGVLLSAQSCGAPPDADEHAREPAQEVEQTAYALTSETSRDIGAVGAAGSWTVSNGVHQLSGSGADIWNAGDEFRFAYHTVVGDTTITARVTAIENTHAFAKVGVMIRDGVSASAKNVFVALTPTASNGFRLQTRSAVGSNAVTNGTNGTGSAPRWLRLSRTGNTFVAQHSADGQTWIQIGGTQTIAMNPTVEVGIAVTSHADGTLNTSSFDNLFISGTAAAANRPWITTVFPADGVTGGKTRDPVTLDLRLPNSGGGVDDRTLTSSTVRLVRASDGVLVPATVNTSAAGDVIVLQPSSPLTANTRYIFTVSEGVKDLTGQPFIPFSSTFTTGVSDPVPTGVAFTKVALPNTNGRVYTSITRGPDGRLYAATLTGEIVRFALNSDGTTQAPTVISSVRTANGGAARAIVGLTFDPAATSSNLILWVTHGPAALTNAPDWSGKLSKLTGPSLATVTDVLVKLPRSSKDHLTNSIAFKPSEPAVLYIAQGSMSAMGAPDNAWANRAEHLLAGAILRLDTTKLPTTLPLDVQTNDSSPGTGGTYNPFASGAPLTIYATGVRNAYDLIWHSNGSLYVPTNGSAEGGATPATPSTLPAACTRRIDDSTNGDYTGPKVPAIGTVTVAQNDFLFRVVGGGYYGHPNPSRCEWVLNGGDPTSGTDRAEVAQYPNGTQPDRNWRGHSFDFGKHYSPNGVIEYKSDVLPALKGKLVVARFSGGDDLIVLTLSSTTKDVSSSKTGYVGTTGFSDPLDLVENPSNGYLYVTEHAGEKITLLRPKP